MKKDLRWILGVVALALIVGTVNVTNAQLSPVGTGVIGRYYQGTNFEELKITRIDPQINFDWGNGSPDTSIIPDNFSARWVGRVKSQAAGSYTFCTNADNGERLWVNSQLLVDDWSSTRLTQVCGNIVLGADTKYDLKMEFYNVIRPSNAKLYWTVPGQAQAIIPTANLYPEEPVVAVSLVSVNKTAAPAELPAEGGVVTYTYTVTNLGASPLTNVTLVDDKCSPINGPSGDINANAQLEATEVWTYFCGALVTFTTTSTATAQGDSDGLRHTSIAPTTVTVGGAAVFPEAGFGPNNNITWIMMGIGASLFALLGLALAKKRA